jgi:hypothetical protein
MSPRSTITTALAAMLIFAGVGPLTADTTPARVKPVLKIGMDADTIVSLYGKPAEIQLMDTADLRAEKWIYRRKAREYTTQDASDVAMIPAYIGNGGTGTPIIDETPILQFRIKRITVYQVTALLLVDGKLRLGKQWHEQEEKFTN